MDDSPADRLELFLAREFLTGYIRKSLANRRTAVIDPNRIYMAARFQGLRVSTATLAKVISEFSTTRT